MTKKGIKPPKTLSKEGTKLWNNILSQVPFYDFGGLAVLESVCESYGSMKQYKRIVDKFGVMLKDRFGQPKLNPAVIAERDARSAFLKGMKALNLDFDAVQPPGKKPGSERV